MNIYQKAFEDGLTRPYMTISEKEALRTACQIIGVFTDSCSEQMVRHYAMYEAGSHTATIKNQEIHNILKDIFERCADLEDNQAIVLTNEDKLFIKKGITGSFYKEFYL